MSAYIIFTTDPYNASKSEFSTWRRLNPYFLQKMFPPQIGLALKGTIQPTLQYSQHAKNQ